MPEIPLFKFKTKEDIDRWFLEVDSSSGGKSTAKFYLSPQGTGIFEGNISLETTGRMLKSGFAAIVTKPVNDCWNLNASSGLEMRLKSVKTTKRIF